MKNIKFLTYLLLCITVLCVFSCTKMNGINKYAPTGEIKYTGKVDSINVYSGKGRVKLTMMLGNDLSRTKIKVYWNNRADSAEMNLQPTSKKDTVSMFINNLAEGQYNFNIYTYDVHGNSSVVSYANGTVYGNEYYATLSNRTLKAVELSDNGQNAILIWPNINPGEIGIEVKYTDNAGIDHKVIVHKNELTTEIPNYKPSSLLSYKSLFIPVPQAIDTFSTDYSIVTLPIFEKLVDKSKFQAMLLPTDASDAYGWIMPNLWDSNFGDPGFHTPPGSLLPQWFTFDMGTKAKLSRFKLWQRTDGGFLFDYGNPQKWEVWGSNNPDADGGWTNWTKLLDCESVKPSGLPLGQSSSEDLAYAMAGEQFVFPAGTPPVRFIRFKTLNTWSGNDFVHIAELSFWTHDR
jgi:hypothetical protein